MFTKYTFFYCARFSRDLKGTIRVDSAAGFTIHGTVDHSRYYNSAADCYWSSQDIRRSMFMGEYLYARSDRAVTVNRTDNMTETDAIELPGTCYEDMIIYPEFK